MKTIDLKAVKRQETGKKSTKELRRNGMIPCVLYGGEEAVHFTAPVNDFRHLVYTPEVYLVNLTIDNDDHKAIIKDLQFHPVTDEILHIDFLEVLENKPVEVGIPVKVTGFSKGVQAGGKLHLEMRRLKVYGFSRDLPNNLTIDVTKVGLGDSVKVRDLSFDNLELRDPKSAVVVSVKLTRVAKGMTVEEEVEGEEGAEGEGEGEETEESSSEE
jgi:large subunit ribosomal protein L25